MEYDKSKYIGKAVRLDPGDTYYKYAVITDLDDLGWTFKITKSSPSNGENWKVGQSYFINHSRSVIFEFI
jgi:hypothetical protein